MGNLYTKLKVFHYKDKVDSLPSAVDKILPPVHIRIKPTNICTHNCTYCAYRVSNLQLGKDMDQRDFIPRRKMMEIVEDIIDMGVRAVTFSGGGDPFCYPCLAEIAEKLAASSVKFSSLTNGALLCGEAAKVFAHNAKWLRISMDGWNDESYSAYRGVEHGEFNKILKNIEDFKGYGGKCYLGVCIIVDRRNAAHIYELISQLKNRGVDSVKIAPCIVSNIGKDNNDYHKDIFDEVKNQISKALDNFAAEDFEIFDSYHSQLETFEKKYTWCPYLQILPIIGADCNIYSCQDKAYNLDEGLIGSIKETRFKDFWFLNKDKFFKINPSVHCNHHCVADGKNKLLLDYLNVDKEHLDFV
ncbi:MAG: radical SAM protein [Candidatus Omnitrophica bacterium]|nr:radical SAM protein [Candidatus Omnitrophota bacterium]